MGTYKKLVRDCNTCIDGNRLPDVKGCQKCFADDKEKGIKFSNWRWKK